MAWDGSGNFSRTNGDKTGSTTWQLDQAANIKIKADRHDTHDQDLANGINNCLTKDGQNTPTADMPMGGRKHTNVSDGSARNHYATLGQVQDGGGIWGGTATGTADAITISVNPSPSAYTAGQIFRFLPSAANTGAVTLNVSGVGVTAVKKGGGLDLAAGDLKSGKQVAVCFDGTEFQLLAEPWKEWLDSGHTPTFATTTTFTIPGNVTSDYTTGRRLRITDATTLYGTVDSSAYTSNTTVTVTLDSGDLSASLSKVEVAAVNIDSLPSELLTKTEGDANYEPLNADLMKRNVTANLTKGHTTTAYAIGNSGTGTLTIDPTNGHTQTLTVNGSFTIDVVATNDSCTTILVTNDAVGGHGISMPTGFLFIGEYKNTANLVQIFEIRVLGGTKILTMAEPQVAP